MCSGLLIGTLKSWCLLYNTLFASLAPLVFSLTEHLIGVQLQCECHILSHDPSTKFAFHKTNDLLVNSHGERTNQTVAIAAHVKPSLNVASDVFVEIVSLHVVNQGVSVHVAELKIHTILWSSPSHIPSIRFSLKIILDLKFGFIILLRHVSSFVTRLISLCFLFSIIFPNTELFMSLKKSFSKFFLALV